MKTITYDTISLQSDDIITTEVESYSSANVQNQIEPLTLSDGGILVKRRLSPKIVQISGYMRKDTQAELEAVIDFFHQSLNKKQKFLDMDYNGATRRYIATPQTPMIMRSRGLNYAEFSVDFLVPAGYGSDTESTTLLDTTTSSSNIDLSFEVGGSYRAEPLIEITIDAVTGGTGASISVSNTTTLETVTVSADYTAGDVLEIDVENKECRINGGIVDFTGRIPSWVAGTGLINYTDTFTTRTTDILLTYTKRYI